MTREEIENLSDQIQQDAHGAYIDILETDDDYVSIIKKDGKFYHRIRGPIPEGLNKLIQEFDLIKKERDELLYAISHTRAMKRFLAKMKGE